MYNAMIVLFAVAALVYVDFLYLAAICQNRPKAVHRKSKIDANQHNGIIYYNKPKLQAGIGGIPASCKKLVSYKRVFTL